MFVPTWPSLFIDVKVGDNHEAMAAARNTVIACNFGHVSKRESL